MTKTLLLVDAHAMIHRAFHALPESLATSDGTPTNAVYGFFLMFQKILTDFRPTHIAVCFDTPKPTFRKKLFTGYQAKRPKMDDTLRVQIPMIRHLLDIGGVSHLEREGYEADDVIGSVAEHKKGEFDRVLIVTGDRDLLQLVDDRVMVIAPKNGISHFDLFTPDSVQKKYGLPPAHVPDYKALAGDASDNYNTARGIGPKTATKLLTPYGSVENLFEHLESVENERIRTILRDNKETILLFKQIATIIRDIDINPATSSLAFSQFREDMKEELKKLELFSLINTLWGKSPRPKSPEKTHVSDGTKTPDQLGLF